MHAARWISFSTLAFTMYAALATCVGFAWFWRSDAYVAQCTRVLETALGLPAQIGGASPRSLKAHLFHDVVVWTAERSAIAMQCEEALVRYTTGTAYELELRGGRCEISPRTWLRPDYRGLLEQSLRPGFDPLGPERVVVRNMRLELRAGGIRLDLPETAGEVRFGADGRGDATLYCGALNGRRLDPPIQLRAAFAAAANGVRIDDVTLTIPPAPLADLDLGELVSTPLTTGMFAGSVVYRETDLGDVIVMSGLASDVDLCELTTGRLPQPWIGRCAELHLQELRFVNGAFAAARFSGVITNLELDGPLTLAGLPQSGASALLRVRVAELSPSGIDLLGASAACQGFDLGQFSAGFEAGGLSGVADIAVDDLVVTRNRLVQARAAVTVRDEPAEASYIERGLLRDLLRRGLGLALPDALIAWLPEEVLFSDVDFSIDVDNEVLRLTPRQRENGLLRLHVAGGLWPVQPPRGPLHLGVWLDAARAELAEKLQMDQQR